MPQSRVFLPKVESPPATILEHLAVRFPHIPVSTWRDRMARGLVTSCDGAVLREDSPYRHGMTVLYAKEVPSEPAPLEVETILYQDDEILIADKPHGMTVTPGGQHVARSLLNRLQKQTGIADLVPLHRLDRDTAGIVLFSSKAGSRGRYHQLFSSGVIEREYLAVASVVETPTERYWILENRLIAGIPWFRRNVESGGPVNAITEIELIETRDNLGLFRLKPRTGKKHQLRVHMSLIGFPILGDPLYPQLREPAVSDPPLQLLARRLSFADPFTGLRRDFRSARELRYFATLTLA
jgi:tRNA pseudouridine32 synthase / 23S rRNA pseudouridine746 synthase